MDSDDIPRAFREDERVTRMSAAFGNHSGDVAV
jgi:hypothetical protein